MHPQVHEARPGVCPICGMDLLVKAPGEVRYNLPLVDPDCAEPSCLRGQVSRLLAAASRPDQPEALRSIAVMAASDDLLIAALDDGEGLVRSAAAVEIARREIAGALPSLHAAAIDDRRDPQGWSRLSAIDTIARLGDASATALLRPWLRHDDAMARSFAAGLSERHPKLRAQLDQIHREDPSAEVRAQAQLALATLGDAMAIASVKRREDAHAFRTRLRLDPSFAEELAARTTLQRNEPQRDGLEFVLLASATSALLEAGDPRGREALHRMLQDADDLLALPLLQNLHRHATLDDISIVVPYLGSRDPLVRTAAALLWWKVMGQTGP